MCFLSPKVAELGGGGQSSGDMSPKLCTMLLKSSQLQWIPFEAEPWFPGLFDYTNRKKLPFSTIPFFHFYFYLMKTSLIPVCLGREHGWWVRGGDSVDRADPAGRRGRRLLDEEEQHVLLQDGTPTGTEGKKVL